MGDLDLRLVEIALDKVSADDFEKFANAFCPSVFGVEFIPTGGMHDGGADAYHDTGLFEGKKPDTFYQVSTQENHRQKLRDTVGRLRRFGRAPKIVIYISSRTIETPDAEEEILGNELDTVIKIRGRSWIVNNVQGSASGVLAFNSYLSHNVEFMGAAGGATLLSSSTHLKSRSVCVFLGQEVERRSSKSKLVESLSDSLILWSLDSTDPDSGKFCTRDEMVTKIEDAFPPSKAFIRGLIDSRIAALSAKENTAGREIRWYAKEKKGCLPYSTRQTIQRENIEDEYLKTKVKERLETDAAAHLAKLAVQNTTPSQIAEVVICAAEKTFINNGLELAAFLRDGGTQGSCPPISENVDEAMQSQRVPQEAVGITKEIAMKLLRKAFYESTEDQRIYFGKLSRTYTLLFSLQADAKTAEYFQHMSGEFVLFVGTDIIVRALAEQYLPKPDQMTCNLLAILAAAGSTLILCGPVLDEVHRHLETTDWEFENFCARQEQFIDANIARHCSKILIRSYFYAKLNPAPGVVPARNWGSFIGQFCDHKRLHSADGKRQLQQYLVQRFKFSVIENEELSALTREDEVAKLAEQLRPYKRTVGQEVLAENDARLILGVYGKRLQRREVIQGSAYGLSTWWLTHETLVQKATSELVRDRGAKYILRPDFVLNFICLSPKTEEVRNAYRKVIPTLLAVQLSNRMREDIFHDVMNKVAEVTGVDDARAKVMMADLSNRLKGDFFKQYEVDWQKAKR